MDPKDEVASVHEALQDAQAGLAKLEGVEFVRRPLSSGPFCNFCGKSQDDRVTLIAGPSVHICNECVDACKDILTRRGK